MNFQNWKEKTWKEKFLTLLPFLGILALAGVIIYSAITPDFLWTIKKGNFNPYKKRILYIAFLALWGILVFFGNFRKNPKTSQKTGIMIFALTPIVVFLSMEYANPAGPSLIWLSIRKVSIIRSLATILILYLITAAIFAFTNSTRFTGCFISACTVVLCLANYFTNAFRGIPILASDLSTIQTAMNVAGNYEYVLNYAQLIMITTLILWCILLFRVEKVRLPKGRKRIPYAVSSLVVLAASGYLLIFTPAVTETLHITINTFRPIKSYAKNGAILTFVRSIQLMIVEAPEGYSPDAADQIAEPYRREQADKDTDARTPNVIAIMDEAFADLQAVGDFKTSEEVMPFYKSLTENTVKGFVYVSVFGGQTANSEFEFLTGLSKAFIAESATPYQLYIKSLLPGLTTHLGSQNYQGMTAFHPYNPSGYNRHNVYPNLGFSRFLSLDDLSVDDDDLLRTFVSDQSDFDTIIEEYEKAKAASNAPFYLFNVTMQNHSDFSKDFDNFKQPITIEPDYDNADARRYLNLVHYSDQALQSLIEYFQKTDDPTVIVFFGDHEPGLSDEFYSKLYGKDIEKLTDVENLEMYKTPFLIWANYDIEEKQNVNTSANYLSTLMLESTGMEMTPFNGFLSDLSKDIPILTSHGYIGSDGKYYKLDDTSSPYYPELCNYSILQYNTLFDKKNRIADFFD